MYLNCLESYAFLTSFSTIFSVIATKIPYSIFSGLSLNHIKLCLQFKLLYGLNKCDSKLQQWIHYMLSKSSLFNTTLSEYFWNLLFSQRSWIERILKELRDNAWKLQFVVSLYLVSVWTPRAASVFFWVGGGFGKYLQHAFLISYFKIISLIFPRSLRYQT